MAVARWEHFPHEADVGVAGYAPTLAGAFEQAALALTAVVTDPADVRLEEAVPIACCAADAEALLVEWLNALVYEMAVEGRVFGRYEVEIERERLRARALGERLDPQRHRPAVEIKGATYTGLEVGRGPEGVWHARCVVDV